MRRDICYFFAADVPSVYNAYLSAATNAKFRRECGQEPYHTLWFGLNFSMKYNMNGGSCNIHFIQYNGGTAVDLRFSVAQLGGARYERYANDLTNDAVAVLGIPGQKFKLDINEFLNETNKITPENVASASSSSTPEPTQQQGYTPKSKLRMSPSMMTSPSPASASSGSNCCSNCGQALSDTDIFCSGCGTKVQKQSNNCPVCGATPIAGASFCSNCGTKL